MLFLCCFGVWCCQSTALLCRFGLGIKTHVSFTKNSHNMWQHMSMKQKNKRIDNKKKNRLPFFLRHFLLGVNWKRRHFVFGMIEEMVENVEVENEEDLSILRVSDNVDQSWRLNFDSFQLNSHHAEKSPKPSHGLHNCYGVLGNFHFVYVCSSLYVFDVLEVGFKGDFACFFRDETFGI